MSTVNVGNSTNNPVPVNVSAAIAAGGNTIGNVNIQASGSAIAFGQATMANSLPVVIASNQSNLPANITQISGSAVATAATGIMKVGLTDGSGNAITSTSNAIDVNIKSGGGSGFSVVDEAAWTAGTSAFVPTGGVFNDSAAALTSGQEGTARLTNNRAIHVNLRDASANQLLGSKTSANSLPVVVASDQGAVAIGVASGPALVADQTNTILRTSLFVKKTTNADTVLALGSATSANSLPVVVASDQGAIPASQSGTWTVQTGQYQREQPRLNRSWEVASITRLPLPQPMVSRPQCSWIKQATYAPSLVLLLLRSQHGITAHRTIRRRPFSPIVVLPLS